MTPSAKNSCYLKFDGLDIFANQSNFVSQLARAFGVRTMKGILISFRFIEERAR